MRAHAVFAHVLHITGLGVTLDPEFWAPELIPGAMDILRPPVPAGTVQKWRVWLRKRHLAHKKRPSEEVAAEKVATTEDWTEQMERLILKDILY